MKVMQLDHLNLSVDDLQQSIDWYGRVFGFEVVERGTMPAGPWCVIKSGTAMLCIYQHPEREHFDGDELEARKVHGFNHFGLRIDDAAAWKDTVKREDIEVLYDGPVSWPHSTAWYVRDPTGYEIEVALWDDNRIAFD